MLTVETIRKIRLAAHGSGKSIRQISRDLNLARNTVRKVLRSDATRFEYHRETVHRPKLGPFVELLTTWLEADLLLPAKQRRTAQRMYDGLQDEGYRGAYDSVRRFVRVWRRKKQTIPTNAYIPLSFEPGDAFQFDWSHETVQLDSLTTAIKADHDLRSKVASDLDTDQQASDLLAHSSLQVTRKHYRLRGQKVDPAPGFNMTKN